jgi:hypothetical protein
MNSNADRERIENLARDYRNELQTAEAAEGQANCSIATGIFATDTDINVRATCFSN